MTDVLALARRQGSGRWWALVGLLICCFGLGGSARADVPQLVVLRPISVLALAYGLSTLDLKGLRQHRVALVLGGSFALVVALQLVPLPPTIWRQLPGRGLVAEVDALSGLGAVWRPLAMTPLETRNALAALCVPLAGLVLGLQLSPRERLRLAPVILVLGGISALVGLIQVLAPTVVPTLYPITNRGSAVGLFANRNHQGALLAVLLPILVLAAVRGRAAIKAAALLGGVLVLPLILITGSRAGLLLALLALAAVPLILSGWRGDQSGPRKLHVVPRAGLGLSLAGLMLIAFTVWLGRGEAWTRLMENAGDQRLQLLPVVVVMIGRYFPLGTGMGSFERVFQVHEPDVLLGPSTANHAHDDWLELMLEGGLPAALLLVMAIVAFIVLVRRAWVASERPDWVVVQARVGLVIIVLEAAASLVDYPLRTPIHALILTVALSWARAGGEGSKQLDTETKGKHSHPSGSGDRVSWR